MSKKRVDWDKAIELYKRGWSYKEIAEELNCSVQTLKNNRLKQMAEADKENNGNKELVKIKKLTAEEERKPKIQEIGEVYVISSGVREVAITKDKLRQLKLLYCADKLTINQTCRKLDIPRRDFMLIKNAFNITKDDAPYVDEDLENYNIDDLVNATLERKKEAYFNKLQQEEIRQLKREVEKYRKQDYFLQQIHEAVTEHMQSATFQFSHSKKTYQKKKSNNNRKMLEIPLMDLHLGKMAWNGETGENYDYKIAKKRFFFIIEDIIERVENRDIEKILFIFGNDFFNFDTHTGTTTQGTQQDNDLRWQKLFSVGVEMLVKAISMLTEIAPVQSVLVQGNHDKMTSYYAAQYISAWFRNDERVITLHEPKTRKYIRYGNNLLGFTHGDKEKKRLNYIMQVEAAKDWGETKYREWHMGHFHSEETREEGGIIFRNLSSITGTDAWHYEQGYVGSIKKHQSFIWDYKKGLSEILITNIEEEI